MTSMKHFAHVEVPIKLCIVYSGSFFFALTAAMIQGHSFTAYADGQPFAIYEYAWMLGAAILAVCIPQSVINWALRYVKATFAGNVALLEPIIGIVYGCLIWGDTLSMNQIFGGMLAVGGLFLYGLSDKKE